VRTPPGRLLRTLLLLAAGAAGTTLIGFLAGSGWLLPVLGAAVPFPLFLDRVRAGRHTAAAGWVLVWAVLQSVVMGGAVLLFPETAASVVRRGPEYATEMLSWIRTGQGPEGSPRLFLPVHAGHYALFSLVSLLSFGGLGLALGTFLLNYMNFYVAELIRASEHPMRALLFGWPVWATLRVAGFVFTGAALAGFSFRILRRLRGTPPGPTPTRTLLLGLLLVVLDALLKATLAPLWRGLLQGALG
jgi:hypothetical protein